MVEAAEWVIGGVTLAQFAFVRAGLADGLNLGELLGFLRLDARTWEAAEKAWDEQVLDAIEDDPSFLDALDDATGEARKSWTHRVPPLDEDLRAWFDFLHAWMEDADPIAFLERMKVGVTDLAHLHRLWSARLAADAKARVQALEILGGARRAPAAPAPERPRLIERRSAPRRGDGMTALVAHARGQALPFTEGEPMALLPSLAVPLPRRKRPRGTDPDETRLDSTTAVEALPFMASRTVVMDESPLGSPSPPDHAPTVAPVAVPPVWVLRGGVAIHEPTQELAVAPIADPDATTAIEMLTGKVIPLADAFERAPATPHPLLTVDAHARLVAELTTGTDLAKLLARHGLTAEAKQSEDERWARELSRDPNVQRAWTRAFGEARARLAEAGEES